MYRYVYLSEDRTCTIPTCVAYMYGKLWPLAKASMHMMYRYLVGFCSFSFEAAFYYR